MSRKPWNDFVAQHPTSPAFVAKVSSSLPGGPHFDKANKKLPTPYTLFQEWLKNNLSGDWSTAFARGALIVRIALAADAASLTKRFPAVGPAKKSLAAASTTPIKYNDGDYKKLALEVGYSPK